MAASKIIALTALTALGLAGCNNQRERAAGGICTPFANAAATAAAANAPAPMGAPVDASAAVDDCLHRWGYSLARSEDDDADTIAAATVAACASSLARWNQQMLGQPTPGGASGPTVEAPSLLTGEQTTPIAEHYTYAQGRALFYVVQARAGNCPPPRMENGAPAAAGR
jgi:hypothetical protein